MGDFGRGDTSIQIIGLRPGQFYSIRVIASNAANFCTLGPLIRLRTLPSHIKADGTLSVHNGNTMLQDELNEAASIRISPAHFEPAAAQPMVRELSGGHSQPKRASSGRRHSPVTPSLENAQINVPGDDGSMREENSVDHLTEKLDSLRLEQQELDRQILEEEVDFKSSLADLSMERDLLKQTLKEKEEASNELRRQGNLISKQQKTAQSRKAQKERLLNVKKAERKKVKEEILKWNQEIIDIRQELEDMSQEQSDIVVNKEGDISDVRAAIAKEHLIIRKLEDEIHSTGSSIKALEKDHEKMSNGGEEDMKLAEQEKDGDQAWESHVQSLQLHLASLWQTLKQVGVVTRTGSS